MSRTLNDLGQEPHEIARLCRETGEPVFITDGGNGDLVLMSLEAFEQVEARLELYRLLDEAEADFQNGDRGITVSEMREHLRA